MARFIRPHSPTPQRRAGFCLHSARQFLTNAPHTRRPRHQYPVQSAGNRGTLQSPGSQEVDEQGKRRSSTRQSGRGQCRRPGGKGVLFFQSDFLDFNSILTHPTFIPVGNSAPAGSGRIHRIHLCALRPRTQVMFCRSMFDADGSQPFYFSQAIKVMDVNSDPLLLLLNDSTGWLRDKLTRLEDTLGTILPQEFSPMDSNVTNYAFDTLYCDTYNRCVFQKDADKTNLTSISQIRRKGDVYITPSRNIG